MEDLQTALDAGDHDRIAEAFQSGRLTTRSAILLLYHAIEKSLSQGVEFLLRQGVQATSIQPNAIAKCDSVEVLSMLKQAGWPFKEKGHLILHQVLGKQDVVHWLLDHGVRLDFPQSELRDDLKKGEKDETLAILNQAAAQGNMAMFDHLVSLGAEPSRSLALHYTVALFKPQVDSANTVDAVIGHLVQKHHFDVDADDTCGGLVELSDFTVMPGQEGPPLERAVFYENTPAIQSLLRRGAHVGENPIRTAIERDNLDVLQALLEAGGDATYGCSLAVARDKVEAARVCQQHGVDQKAAIKYNRESA